MSLTKETGARSSFCGRYPGRVDDGSGEYRLPRKRSGAGALIFDGLGRLLIVRPSYRRGWLVPGGVVENGESPRVACEREVLEETGLALRVGRLLCVDYWPGGNGSTESMQFLFHGGVLSSEQLANIRLCEQELTEYRFVEASEGLSLLAERLSTRVESCLAELEGKGTTLYLESGTAVE